MSDQPTDYSDAGRTDTIEGMGQSDDTDAATVGRSGGTDPAVGSRDRGNVMLAMALVLAALVVLVAASMVLAPTGSDGVTTQQVDRTDTDIVRDTLSLVFIESRDTLNQSYEPTFTPSDSGADPPPLNYTTVEVLFDPYPFTDEQVVKTQDLLSSLAHRTIGGSIASLEPVANRTTTGVLVRLGTTDSYEFGDETVLAENATGVQDLVFVLERGSLPTSADNATTVEVGDWRVAAYQNQTSNRVRYRFGSSGADDDWQETAEYADLRVNTYRGTVNGEAVDSLAVTPGRQNFTVRVADDRRSDGDSTSGSLNLVAVGAGPEDVGALPENTWQEVVTRPAFNVTYIDATTTFVDRISVDTAYRAFEFAAGGSPPGAENVTLTVETENTSQLVEPATFGSATTAGGERERVSPARAGASSSPSQVEIWESGNVWLPDYVFDTTYRATVRVNTSNGETTQVAEEGLLSLHTRDGNGSLQPCECAEITVTEETVTDSFRIDPYALRESLVLRANTSELPGVETDVIRDLTIVDPYREPSLALEETAQVGESVQTDRTEGAFSLRPRKTSLPGTVDTTLQNVSLRAAPAQAVTRYVAETVEGANLTSAQVGAAVSGLETLREQYASASFNQSQNATALLENFSAAPPAEQAAMVNLTGVRAERALPAFEAINEVVGTVSVNSSDIVAASSPAYAAGAGALVGEPYTAATLPVLNERASHAQIEDEHPPTWWLNRLANADLSDSQQKTLGRLYGGADPSNGASPSAWNETIVTFINNIQQFRDATETLWGEGVLDGTLKDIMYEESGGNSTLRNAIPAVHAEMETASDLGLNPSVAGVSDIEAFLLAAGVTDPEGAAYTEAASLIDNLSDDGEPITYEDVLFGMTSDQVQLLDESALGATPPTYELASGADLTADWDAGVTARYTETSPEHGHTLGPYRASDVVTLSGVSSTEIAGLSVRLTANASVAALRDSGLLNGSEVGPQPLVVDQPRRFRVSVTYVNGSTQTLDGPVAAGVNLAVVGPTGSGGADVPSAPEEFATLDIENNTITAQAATGNWTGTGSSGPITLQASLGDLTDTATAQAVNVSVRGAALWRNLSQSSAALAPGSTPRTTVYSDVSGFDRKVLRPGVVYTARQGSLATGWHNRTGVPVSPADVGSVTNGNETAASFYTDTQFNPVTEPYTLVAETPSDGWENITVQTISESAALNFSALGYAAPTYDAVAQYNVTCLCAESGPAAKDPHILTAPGVTSGDLVPSAGSNETISYVDNFAVETPVFNATQEVHPAPKADYPSRTHQTPTQTIEETQTGYIYVWSNFEAAVLAANTPAALEEGTVSWRSAWHCNNPGFFGGGESLPSSCWNKSMGMADFTGTDSNGWSSGLNQTGANQDAVGLNITQHEGGSGVHNYTVAPENVSGDKQVNIAVTGNDETINGDAVNTEVWDITIEDTEQSGGGSSPLDVSIDAPECYPGFEFYPTVSVTNTGDSKVTNVDITLKKGATTIASATESVIYSGQSPSVQSDEGISASGGSIQLSATASTGETSASASWTVDDC